MIIVVSSDHEDDRTINLGKSQLVITSEDHPSDTFEGLCDREGKPKEPTVLLDSEEAYNLYVALHAHFFAAYKAETSVV